MYTMYTMYTFPLYMYISLQSRHYNTAGNLSISATIDLNANHNTCTCTYDVVLVSVYCFQCTAYCSPFIPLPLLSTGPVWSPPPLPVPLHPPRATGRGR